MMAASSGLLFFGSDMLDDSQSIKLDDLLRPTLRNEFERRGFKEITPRKWVRSTKLPMREIILLRVSANYTIGWGIGLDFVPRLTNDNLFKWKRTEKSACPDLAVWPDDEVFGEAWNEFTWIPGFECVSRENLTKLIHRSAIEADRTFMQVGSVEQLIGQFDERDKRHYRVPPAFYPQHSLGRSLALRYVGRLAESEEWMERFKRRVQNQYDERFLARAIASIEQA